MDIVRDSGVEWSMSLTTDLKDFSQKNGADLVGIADLIPFRSTNFSLPDDLLDPYDFAISIALRLDNEIMDAITDHPTTEYAGHYRKMNKALDDITTKIVRWTSRLGFRATAIPASFIEDEKNLLGNLSHKAIARMAGIGWQGKSLLIVSPEFGPRIRLATVLTDMPLVPDKPLKNRCGKCTACTKACPASAIRNILPKESHFAAREEAIRLDKCREKTTEFKAVPGIGAMICGVCVKSCPHGKGKNSVTEKGNKKAKLSVPR